MSRFENSYLAESVGYNNGHANGMADGVAVGREHGYTQGWNEATIHANGVIAERNELIDRLYGANERLSAENAQLKQQLQLQQEHAHKPCARSTKAMFKAFLGVSSPSRAPR
jgi:flagellar biosynthesis/type III secretory pathway protein FliH